jgi:hypothetical protein
MELLREIKTGATCLDHFNDGTEMPSARFNLLAIAVCDR